MEEVEGGGGAGRGVEDELEPRGRAQEVEPVGARVEAVQALGPPIIFPSSNIPSIAPTRPIPHPSMGDSLAAKDWRETSMPKTSLYSCRESVGCLMPDGGLSSHLLS